MKVFASGLKLCLMFFIFILVWVPVVCIPTYAESGSCALNAIKSSSARTFKNNMMLYWFQSTAPGGGKNKKKRFHNRNRNKKNNSAPWSLMIKDNRIHNTDSIECDLFRRRFRIPYPIFDIILKIIVREEWFCTSTNAGNK